jgi:hypothetical protein
MTEGPRLNRPWRASSQTGAVSSTQSIVGEKAGANSYLTIASVG